MHPNKFPLGLRCFAVVGILASSGCVTERVKEPEPIPAVAKTSAPSNRPLYQETGEASWYGPGFNGRRTASGETFNQDRLTAAHRSLPLGTTAEVTNLENGRNTVVEINDRGPYAKSRSIDLSRAAAKKLKMLDDGVAPVKIVVKAKQARNPTGATERSEGRQ